MKKRHAVCGVALLLASVVASPAQTDPGLSIKPAGVTLSGEKIGPEKPPVNLSRPEMSQAEFTPTTETEYFEAAMRGEAWAQAKLGKIYVASTDDPVRIAQGVHLLRQAAEQNDAEALFVLGSLSMAGHGLPQSTDTAFDYCRRAAELGLPEAQYELAAMYALGRGTAVDNNKALEWGRKAMDQGNLDAKYSVGRLLLIRENASDQKEALELLNQAIDGGIDEAGMFLVEAYTSGRHGVPQDQAAATAILGQLSARGNTKAAEAIKRMPSSTE